MVENVKVKFREYIITSDFYIILLGGLPHLVLGVKWLYILGEITSNYKILEMKFKVQGQEVVLCGIREWQGVGYHMMEAIERIQLKFVDSWISHDEDKEDHEDYIATIDVMNCLGISNLGGA